MSTDFILHKDGDKEVAIIERSARFDLDLSGYESIDHFLDGPQHMSAKEAMEMAAGILYAVSCSYPNEVEAFVKGMDGYGLIETWSVITRARQA